MASQLITQGFEGLRARTQVLTNAQVLALRATPIEIVEAAPAKKKHVFLFAALKCDGTAGAFTNIQNMALKYTNGSGVAVSANITGAGFADQSAAVEHTNVGAANNAIVTDAGSIAQNIVLHNIGGSEITGGNAANTLTCTVYFVTVDV